MLIDLIPSKFISTSLAAHSLVVVGLVYQSDFLSSDPKKVSLVQESQGSVEVFFEAQKQVVKKKVVKPLKKLKRQYEKADLADKLVPKEEILEEEVQEISLKDIKALQNNSPDFQAFLKSLQDKIYERQVYPCLLYTSPSPRDQRGSRMPSSA